MQYQIPSPHPLIKQAPSNRPPLSPDFNEPVFMNEDWTTAWMNRNVLYYPTVTNKPPNAQYIQPRIDFDPTVWLRRGALFYPTVTNKPPNAKFIEPRIDFDPLQWLDFDVKYYPTITNKPIPKFIEPRIDFDPTGWMHRQAFRFPTTTNKPFQALFLEPRIYFDNGQMMIQGTLQVISPSGVVVVKTPLRMRMGMGL